MPQRPKLPTVAELPVREHHTGKINFVERVIPDLARTGHFYSCLLGWSFQVIELGSATYAHATLNGQPVAGLVHKLPMQKKRRRTMWLGFFAVTDVAATNKKALEHGGRVLMEPLTVPDRGCEGILEDPQGAAFGIIASTSGDPPDFLAAPGEWVWSALLTRNPRVGAGFYQVLFDYQLLELPTRADPGHLMFVSHSLPRASVSSLAPMGRNHHPSWLHYVRVEDAVQVAEKAVSLGGRILDQPRFVR